MWKYAASLVFSLLFAPSAFATTRKNVLILHEGSRLLPYQFELSSAIQKDLSSTRFDIQVFEEYLDSWRLSPDPRYALGALETKYVGVKFDVVIVDGNRPFQAMLNRPPAFLRSTPVVFVTLPDYDVPYRLPPNITGITVHKEYSANVRLAQRLQPGLQHIFFVQSGLDSNPIRDAAVRGELATFRNQLDIVNLENVAVDDLLERVASLPPHSAILYDTYFKDPSGKPYVPAEVSDLIAKRANAPLYALYQTTMANGALGGVVIGSESVGKQAAEIVLGLLAGAPVSRYPVEHSQNKILIDWRGLQRFGLSESRLPSSAVILNRPPTLWESYKRYVIGGTSLITLEALLIGGLLWQRTRRRKVESDLVVTNDRLRLALEAGTSVGWEWNVRSRRDQWFGDLQTMFGIPEASYSGAAEDFYRFLHPEDRERVQKAVADARQSRKSYIAEFRVVRTDGAVRWVTATGKYYYAENGDPERMLGMAVDITDRKQAEQELRASEDRLAGIVGSAMDAIIAVDEERRIVLFNTAAEKMLGCTQGEAIGTIVDRFIPERHRAKHEAYMRRFTGSGVTTPPMEASDGLWAVRTNGQEFPVEASIIHIESEGRSLFTVTIRDITERRLAEEAIRESEQRFRLVANTAPVMIWMSGPDKLCNYFNKPWLEFSGRPLEAELGDGWAEGVHPEDLRACLDTYVQAFDRRESFSMQYRLRRYDGEYRWLLDIGVPRSNPDGSFEGYIGSCIDITDRKRAEEALVGMGRRLIEAQEQERAWIARELHDDVNQRILLLVFDLELWVQQLPDSAADIRERMRHGHQRLSDIVSDIEALSHRLHSSKLEYLGLVAAARSFCRELAEQQKVEIDFTHKNIPDGVPGEISLCLFRVLQEALQNAVKYSGVRQFAAKLRGTEGEIRLTVTDLGVGFDPHEAVNGHGLGLISMRERLHLAGGQFSVESQPGMGTTVRARVRFSSANNSEAAHRITAAVSPTS